MTDIVRQAQSVLPARRAEIKGQRPCLIWMTGLSGAGKSTLADMLDRRLVDQGAHTYVLDGDNVRHGLCKDLGFSPADRTENIRRVGAVGRMFVDAGLITIAAFISPYRADRAMVRRLFAPCEFVEVFVDAPLEHCEVRDPKGLYRKARAGTLAQFTGVSSPYEAPEAPELRLETAVRSPGECVDELLRCLALRGILGGRTS